MTVRLVLLCVWYCFAASAAGAGPQSLLNAGLFGTTQAGLFDGRDGRGALLSPPRKAERSGPAASLFAVPQGQVLWAPTPDQVDDIAALLSLIAVAEAGKAGYDAVQLGARILPGRPPTQMTLGDIDNWTRATPGQPHAIGRYQFIPKTLRRLVRALGLERDTRFTPEVQDALAGLLLEEAGLTAFRAGTLPQRDFMNNLAKIWAGLPNESGQSHYHGYAGNKAVITWPRFYAEMSRIFGQG